MHTALQAVNSAMLTSYWHVGREIVQEEQLGHKRAEYGKQPLQVLSVRLKAEFGVGFSVDNLKQIRRFYLVYADRRPSIGYALNTQSLPPAQTDPSPRQLGTQRIPNLRARCWLGPKSFGRS